MNIIVIMGPHGAGKDSLLGEIFSIAETKYRGNFAKTKYVTTRKIRNDEIQGVTVNCVSSEEFERMKQAGELACFTPVADYFSGTQKSEFKKAKFTLMIATYSVIVDIEKTFESENPHVFKIYIDVPREERVKRILARNPEITADRLAFKLDNDPNIVSPDDLKKMNLVLQNEHGKLKEVAQNIFEKIKQHYKI